MSLCTSCSCLSTTAVFKIWYTINHCLTVSTLSYLVDPGFISQPIHHQIWKRFLMFSLVPLGKYTHIYLHNSKFCNFRPTKSPHLNNNNNNNNNNRCTHKWVVSKPRLHLNLAYLEHHHCCLKTTQKHLDKKKDDRAA